MTFTFPVYITVNAKTREAAKEVIRIGLDYERLFGNWSYTISHPINAPDTPTRLKDPDVLALMTACEKEEKP